MSGSEARKGWDAASAAWASNAETLSRQTIPVSEWLIDAVAPQPGHTLLELACGTGEVGLLAAELVQPGGEVILSDFSPGMLTAAQERAAGRGLTNVRFKQIDAQSIDWPAATLDGVLCRWAFMLMDDPEAALRETRRVLRPGRNLALAVWAARERNPWRALLEDAAIAHGHAEPAGDAPGMFAWGARETVVEHLQGAGFVEFEVELLEFAQRFPSTEVYLDVMRQLSGVLRPALEHADVRDAVAAAVGTYAEPDGSLALPAATWVAWAAA